MEVVGLKVDNIEQPLGLESNQPRFSWQLASPERNVRQAAYRVLVASSEDKLGLDRGDVWDSGIVNSRGSLGIQYRGPRLKSRSRYYWRVQVWEKQSASSISSTTSWWEMGLLNPADWSAKWLAVEDAVAKADREFGLDWIWGESSKADNRDLRRFRFKFRLPNASKKGELFAVSKNWQSPITTMWIDGDPVVIPDKKNISGERIKLEAMSAGEHLVAIEFGTQPYEQSVPVPDGLVFFARFELKHSKILRLKSGTDWRTSLVKTNDWYTKKFDDSLWENAQVTHDDNQQPWPPMQGMYLRREFALDKKVVKARLYATALGAYEARLNGARVGDALLTPESSQYEKRVLYRVYDVTAMMRTGSNALGLNVGDGWYASFDGYFAWGPPPRRVIAQLELTFSDGSHQVVNTDPNWRITHSPIIKSEIRIGETYDARLDQQGWDSPDFNDSEWQNAEALNSPVGRLVAQTSPPIRVTQILKPRAISQSKPDIYLCDFGQNFTGWCRLHVKGKSGARIELQFGELLLPTGEIDQSVGTMGDPKSDVFILKGDAGGEILEPHFTYRGFRYVQIIGLSAAPTTESVEGLVVHTDLDMSGQLRIDNPLLETTWRNTVLTQRSNFTGVPTDCPSREQRGWMADAGAFWDAAAFNMDIDAFTRRHMGNVSDEQFSDGALASYVPIAHQNNMSWRTEDGSAPAWGDAGIILPWTVWRRYGDLTVIEENWQVMNRYAEFIVDNNPGYIRKNKLSQNWGDWMAPSDTSFGDTNAAPVTPKDLIGTAYWAYSVDLLAQMAEAIGRTADAERLRVLHGRIRRAFNEEFVKPDCTIGNGSQTSYVLAIKFDLLSDEIKTAAAERLAADVRKQGISLTTGIVGTQFILDVLADAGYRELSYSLLLKTEHPSWGYMVKNGATNIWENWFGGVEYQGKFIRTSQNHYAFGSVVGFLFRRIAGIDAAEPGFEKIIVRLALDPRVKKGGGDYDSVMGRISTDWTQNADGSFKLDVTIPANSSAHIYLPAAPKARIQESRRDISGRDDLRVIDRLDKETVIEAGSGHYTFFVTR